MFSPRRIGFATLLIVTLFATAAIHRVGILLPLHSRSSHVTNSSQDDISCRGKWPTGSPNRSILDINRTTGRAGHIDVGKQPELFENAYSRVVVVPRMSEADVSWIQEQLADLNVTMYIPDQAEARLHPPKNKGHEVMVYISYIIDHYHHLPDVTMFMHSHRFAHHNNEVLGFDAVQMIRQLQNDHVIRQGYFNLRCSWSPGCPVWLHSNPPHEILSKQEEAVLSESWQELFPQEEFPSTLSQACCAQFAVSKERVLSLPKSRYIFYRDWILRTPLSDYVSGRIWEYSWQILFAGRAVVCPPEDFCYCEGFGVCFGGQSNYTSYQGLHAKKLKYEAQLGDLREKSISTEDQFKLHTTSKETKQISELEREISFLEDELVARRDEAIRRGDNAKERARDCRGVKS